jgi:hypothetical protein
VDSLWFFEARTLMFGREAIHVVDNKLLKISTLENIGALRHACLKLFDGFLIRVYDCDAAVLERVAVNETLLDEGREHKDVLEFFWRNVLALRQLEDILGAVDDLDRAVREDLGNVTSSEPALFVERFFGLIVTEEVALENRWSLHANLASWIRFISGEVLHFRNIL